MHKAISISGVIAISIFMLDICFGKMELARDGQAQYAIIINTNSIPAEQFAAQELGDYLAKVTGARFNVMSETNPALPSAVYVGWTDFAGKQGIDLKSLGAEEWVIKSFGENLVLTGGRPRGTLYAVYEFLEQQVGCRWLDEFTESVPSKPELKLNNLDIKGCPAFWGREISSRTGLDWKPSVLFSVRNKRTLGWPAPKYGAVATYGSPGGAHTFYAYSKDWQTNHPEYLAMNEKGERVRSIDGNGPGQICLTNPEGRKALLEKLRQYIIQDREKSAKAGSPPPRIYAIESNDNNLTCQCPGCKALVEREGANSGATIDLVNFLADGIKDEFPDVLVDTFAYLQTLAPPKTIRPRDNVIIRLAQLNARPGTKLDGPDEGNRLYERPDYFRPMTNAINRSCYETLVNWSKITKHISCWDYWVQYLDKFQTPYINLVCIKSDLKLFLDNNVEIMYVENEYSDTSSFFSLKHWLGLKLMQNPRQPAEPLVEIFMSGYYGPAASKMSAYLAYMEQRINAVPETTEKLSVPEAQDRPYLDLDFYVTSTKLLDEAEAMCGTNKQALLHVQRERIPVDSGLLGMWDSLQSKLLDGKTMPFDREAILKRYAAMRLAQMEAFYSKDNLPGGKAELEKEIANFLKIREKPLIEKIKAEKQPPAPVLRVPRLGDEAAAGDPAKVDWTKATMIGSWRSLYGIERPQRQIKGALAQDGKYLYFSLEETIESAKLIRTANIYSGDDWELFFAGQRGKTPYRQIGINPDGKHFDYEWKKQCADCAAWTNNAMVKSAVSNGQWQVKISIPLVDLIPNGAKAGQPFYMNIFRGCLDPMCWSPVFDEGFHDLTHLAELTLE